MIKNIIALGLVATIIYCVLILSVLILDQFTDGAIAELVGKKIEKFLAKWSDEE